MFQQFSSFTMPYNPIIVSTTKKCKNDKGSLVLYSSRFVHAVIPSVFIPNKRFHLRKLEFKAGNMPQYGEMRLYYSKHE